jgi:hypothetical protein
MFCRIEVATEAVTKARRWLPQPPHHHHQSPAARLGLADWEQVLAWGSSQFNSQGCRTVERANPSAILLSGSVPCEPNVWFAIRTLRRGGLASTLCGRSSRLGPMALVDPKRTYGGQADQSSPAMSYWRCGQTAARRVAASQARNSTRPSRSLSQTSSVQRSHIAGWTCPSAGSARAGRASGARTDCPAGSKMRRLHR